MSTFARQQCCAHGAREAAASLRLLGVAPERVDKAKNPLNKKSFDQIVAEVALELIAATEDVDLKFAGRVLGMLDVDFEDLTASQREEILNAAMLILPRPAVFAGRVAPVFGARLEEIVRASRMAALPGVKLPGMTDDEVMAHLADSPAYDVAAYMAQRNAELDRKVRVLVGRALTEGWTRKHLSKQLEKLLSPEEVLERAANYYDVVASAYVGYARTYGVLSAFEDAEIKRFRFDAVLDEVTSNICRFMHGTVFETTAALDVYRRMAGNLGGAKEAAPWLREGVNADGERILYTKSFGSRKQIAVITRSGVGIKDDVGRYTTAQTPDSLMKQGICIPPLHGRCRSSIVAEG